MDPGLHQLVGRPYAFPSDPPRTFDCWTLVKHVRTTHGLLCPLPFSDTEEWCRPGNLARGTALARRCWNVEPKPSHLAMAVLEDGHVGVVVGDGVLHALSRHTSVVWTRLPMILRRWPQAEWWTA